MLSYFQSIYSIRRQLNKLFCFRYLHRKRLEKQNINRNRIQLFKQQLQQNRCQESLEDVDIDSQDGAPSESLIQFLSDPTKFNLDPNNSHTRFTTIQNKFKIFSIEINQKAFEKYITSIQKIIIPNNFTETYQSDCSYIRNFNPIVFSKYKVVQLLKIKDTHFQDDVYILKMSKGQTYKLMNEAMIDCRFHLISKRLIQKFISDLNDKGFNTPPIRYQDLLILQEHEKSFWITERFFRVEFRKFNDNQGYINDFQETLTVLVQVFSYYQ